MAELGLLLLTVSLGDLVASGLSGEPASRRRLWLGIAVGILVACLTAFLLLGFHLRALFVLLLASGTSTAWLLTKGDVESDTAWKRPRVALSVLAAGVLAGLLFGDHRSPRPLLDPWLEASPFPFIASLSGPEMLLFVGVLLALSAPANGVVRAVLTIVGTPWQRSATRLRGGRVIGALERWLIFGLAVAGEPTAAALIVSAKSLLRFPELTRTAREPNFPTGRDSAEERPSAEIDLVTEYFLLGSLLSWTLALAAALLFWAP